MPTTRETTTQQLDPQVSGILEHLLKQMQLGTPLKQLMTVGAAQRLATPGYTGQPSVYKALLDQLPPDLASLYSQGYPVANEFFSTGLSPYEQDVHARNAQRGVADVLESTPARGGALDSQLRDAMISAALNRSGAESQARQRGLERAGAVAGVNVPIPNLPRTATSSTRTTRQPSNILGSLLQGGTGSFLGGLLGLGSNSGLFSSLSGLFSPSLSGTPVDLFGGTGTLTGDFGGGFSPFDFSSDIGNISGGFGLGDLFGGFL